MMSEGREQSRQYMAIVGTSKQVALPLTRRSGNLAK